MRARSPSSRPTSTERSLSIAHSRAAASARSQAARARAGWRSSSAISDRANATPRANGWASPPLASTICCAASSSCARPCPRPLSTCNQRPHPQRLDPFGSIGERFRCDRRARRQHRPGALGLAQTQVGFHRGQLRGGKQERRPGRASGVHGAVEDVGGVLVLAERHEHTAQLQVGLKVTLQRSEQTVDRGGVQLGQSPRLQRLTSRATHHGRQHRAANHRHRPPPLSGVTFGQQGVGNGERFGRASHRQQRARQGTAHDAMLLAGAGAAGLEGLHRLARGTQCPFELSLAELDVAAVQLALDPAGHAHDRAGCQVPIGAVEFGQCAGQVAQFVRIARHRTGQVYRHRAARPRQVRPDHQGLRFPHQRQAFAPCRDLAIPSRRLT